MRESWLLFRPPSARDGWLLVTLAVFVLYLPPFLSRGMYVDGVKYSCIARNMAEGEGSLWSPVLTPTLFGRFREHPPLAFGIHSLLYRVFGDHWLVDEAYTALTSVLIAVLAVALWRSAPQCPPDWGGAGWAPVLVLFTCPHARFSFTNNLLENTLVVFMLAAVYLLVRGLEGELTPWIAAGGAGIATTFGALVKGPVALFPLMVPLLYRLCLGRPSWRQVATMTATMFAACGASGLLLLVDATARTCIGEYLSIQLFPSLMGERELVLGPTGRWFILVELGKACLPAAAVAGIVAAAAHRWGGSAGIATPIRTIAFWTAVGLSASLPILASPKQNPWYVVPSLPFFSAAIAGVGVGCLKCLSVPWDRPGVKRAVTALRIMALQLLFAIGVWSIGAFGQPLRDSDILEDLERMRPYLRSGDLIGRSRSLEPDGELYSYLYRFHRVSVESDRAAEMFVLPIHEAPPPGYEALDLGTRRYRLARRR